MALISTKHEIKTQQGEITINLNLNLKIEHDGTIKIESASIPSVKKSQYDFDDKVTLEIPDLEENDTLLENFGKEE